MSKSWKTAFLIFDLRTLTSRSLSRDKILKSTLSRSSQEQKSLVRYSDVKPVAR